MPPARSPFQSIHDVYRLDGVEDLDLDGNLDTRVDVCTSRAVWGRFGPGDCLKRAATQFAAETLQFCGRAVRLVVNGAVAVGADEQREQHAAMLRWRSDGMEGARSDSREAGKPAERAAHATLEAKAGRLAPTPK